MATMNSKELKHYKTLEIQDLMAYNCSPKSTSPSSRQIATAPCHFDRLPTELKLQILHQCFVPRVLTENNHFAIIRSDLLNLAAVSKEMHELATPIYYGTTLVLIKPDSTYHRFDLPSMTVSPWIRHLEIRIGFDYGDCFSWKTQLAVLLRSVDQDPVRTNW
jgi:hypothetical protein